MIINGRFIQDRPPAPQYDPVRYHPQSRVEYQIFSSDYFSDADVNLFFGDIWVDEITDISFVLQEQVQPIYGYHSYTYDTVARGQRIITGQFTINFRSTGYLQQILENAEAIQFALEQGPENKIVNPQFYQQYKLDDILKLYGKESFEQIAEEYEKAIWGEEKDEDYNYLTPSMASYFQRNNPFGFDIRFHYGPVQQVYQMNRNQYYKLNHVTEPKITVETLNGVQITGLQKGASIKGQGAPITETYTFIARDLNGTSSSFQNEL